MNTNKEKKTETTKETKRQSMRGIPYEVAGKKMATQPADLIKVGVDVGLGRYAVCVQADSSLPKAPKMVDPQSFKEWLLRQQKCAREVVVCYEAGLFGFELARWIQAQGMKCLVMAPVKLDEKNSRVETDKLNSRDICSRLDRYLAGNRRAMTVCRIPTRDEELSRHQTRQRQQLLDMRKAIAAQGRCFLWQFGHLAEGGNWWEEEIWPLLAQRVEPTILAGLNRLRAVILEVNKQLAELSQELSDQAKTQLPPTLQQPPLGVGLLSVLLLTREVMDWNRFTNRRQIGGFTGLVPSESSTGRSVRQGSITKVGNPRMRAILIEMAWRVVRLQPDYHGTKRWKKILEDKKEGSRARKKAIVAVARVLSVDLWRLATGQTTMEKLGLKA